MDDITKNQLRERGDKPVELEERFHIHCIRESGEHECFYCMFVVDDPQDAVWPCKWRREHERSI